MSDSGKASVTVNRRVYREPVVDAVVAAIVAAIILALTLVWVAKGANALHVVPFPALVSAGLLLWSLISLISVTVVSAAGVRPGLFSSRVIPWEEIDSFAAIETKPYGGSRGQGNHSSFRVLLIPVENRRPFTLDGCGSHDWEARHSVDELNNILAAIRARRTDGPAQS